MEEKIKSLLEQVGRPYQMYNEDGTYQGCFYPVQFLYPNAKRYKLLAKNPEINYAYGISKLKKHCRAVGINDLQMGDIIATRFRDELHVAVYLEFGKIIHVFRDHTLQIGRLKMFKEFQSFRVI